MILFFSVLKYGRKKKKMHRIQCAFKGGSDKFYCREVMINGYIKKWYLRCVLKSEYLLDTGIEKHSRKQEQCNQMPERTGEHGNISGWWKYMVWSRVQQWDGRGGRDPGRGHSLCYGRSLTLSFTCWGYSGNKI